MAEPVQIAIDGPASSGKGTVAREVARRLGYAYIDTGAMFRVVALVAEENGVAWTDEQRVSELAESIDIDFAVFQGERQLTVGGRPLSDRIRGEHIGSGASAVATFPAVRKALLERQRALASRGGVVMDGRDIGSVVLPDAQLKIYLDASVAVRASRRHAEMRARGERVSLDAVRADIIARDHQDKNRRHAPLVRAEGAVYIDTSHQTVEEAAAAIAALARERS
ncbi:MAG: (d)CMP kinase [Myxococcota bacterium]|nr:(d)CMP kinase [Myxococcota bacterium]